MNLVTTFVTYGINVIEISSLKRQKLINISTSKRGTTSRATNKWLKYGLTFGKFKI